MLEKESKQVPERLICITENTSTSYPSLSSWNLSWMFQKKKMKRNRKTAKRDTKRVWNMFLAFTFILCYHLKIFPLFLGILCDPCNHNEYPSGNINPCPDLSLTMTALSTSLCLQLFNRLSPGKWYCSIALWQWPLVVTSKVFLKLRM